MKNFLISLFFACIFAPVVLAEEPVPSNVTLQLLPGEPNEEEVTILTRPKLGLRSAPILTKTIPMLLLKKICQPMSAVSSPI